MSIGGGWLAARNGRRRSLAPPAAIRYRAVLGAGPATKVGSLADTPLVPCAIRSPTAKSSLRTDYFAQNRHSASNQLRRHSAQFPSVDEPCLQLSASHNSGLAPARSQCSRYLRVLVCCCAGVLFSHSHSHSRPSYLCTASTDGAALPCTALHCAALCFVDRLVLFIAVHALGRPPPQRAPRAHQHRGRL